MNLSAEKRDRQNKTKRLRNKMIISKTRTAIKSFEKALSAKDMTLAKEKLALSIKLLDSAVSKGVLHLNTASRKKSRITKLYNSKASA